MHLYIEEASAEIYALRKNATKARQIAQGVRFTRLCQYTDYYSLAVIARRLGHNELSDFLCDSLADYYSKSAAG